jgi:sortase A
VFKEISLLKVGVIAMTLALVFAIVAAVASVALRSDAKQAIASESVATAKSSLGSLVRDEKPPEPSREKPRSLPTASVSKNQSNPGPSGDAAKQQSELPQSLPRAESEQRTLPAGEPDWLRPTQQEQEVANKPRHYNLPAGAIMGLTIDSIGIYDAPVFDSDSQWALANGVAHVPETSLPWSNTPQRNVYLEGHRMGYRGTGSDLIFYNLDKLEKGDEIVLKDRRGRTYKYRVSETFLVDPTDTWVTGQVRNRDMVTLQTCTPIPTFEKRLIVRADRV